VKNVKETIATNLKRLRDSYGDSQTAFAKRCGVPQRTYNDLEKAESYQRLERLQEIAEKCDLRTWMLLVDNFDPSNPPVLSKPSVAEQAFYDRINKMLDSANQ
jgi:transcriptional regulator with XRE-family HTH domain